MSTFYHGICHITTYFFCFTGASNKRRKVETSNSFMRSPHYFSLRKLIFLLSNVRKMRNHPLYTINTTQKAISYIHSSKVREYVVISNQFLLIVLHLISGTAKDKQNVLNPIELTHVLHNNQFLKDHTFVPFPVDNSINNNGHNIS